MTNTSDSRKTAAGATRATGEGKATDAEKMRPTGKACAVCGRPAVVAYRPFCSKRCADVDLHKWLGGHYAIPTDELATPDAWQDVDGDREDR